MCRWDDDYEWTVEAERQVVHEEERRCEDCDRAIPAGERHTEFVAEMVEDEDDLYVFVAYVPSTTPRMSKWWMPGLHTHRIDEDDIEMWEALGFEIDEIRESELTGSQRIEFHYSCNHCRAGNIWLERVCHQSVVLVTTLDLDQHWDEYTAEQLGPDFETLHTLSLQRWRSKLTGELIPAHVVERLANNAAEFALAGNLIHD